MSAMTADRDDATNEAAAPARNMKRNKRRLDREMTHALCRLAQAGDLDARNRVVEANLGLVTTMARRYVREGGGVTYDDLVQEGCIGLMRAVERYDFRHAFSTYACLWIRQAITRAIKLDSLIHVPEYAVVRLNAERRGTEIGPGTAPLSRANRPKAQRARAVGSLDVEMFPDETGPAVTLAELIEDERADTEAQALARVSRRELAAVLRAALTPREARVIRLRFGLGCGGKCEPETLETVGARLGITRERVRQIEQIALGKLRHPRVMRLLAGMRDGNSDGGGSEGDSVNRQIDTRRGVA